MRLSARLKIAARHGLHRAGLDIVRFLDPGDALRRRLDLLQRHRVNVLFDVGANAGQYALTMRALGYGGEIVSFEPSAEAFQLLASRAADDPRWTTVNCALGERQGNATLHVSANSQSSSLLPMLPRHLAADPSSVYTGDQSVPISTLAAEIDQRLGDDGRLFVKVDTQGSERAVVAGTGRGIDRVVGWQVELSMIPLYEGQPLIEEMVTVLREQGFVPMAVEPDFFDPRTGQLLQADGVFFRPEPEPLNE